MNERRFVQESPDMRAAWFWSVLSGVLLTVGFPRAGLFPLSWVALIPLLLAVRDRTPRRALALGYVCGLVHYVTTFYWIHYVVQHYGGLPFPVAASVVLLMAAVLAVYPALFALAARLWRDRPLLWALGLPSLWVTLEWIKAHALSGFPWANLGYTQTPFMPLMQLADVTGVYGVSWLVVALNTAAALCWSRRRLMPVAAVCLVCLAAAVGYGTLRQHQVEGLQAEAPEWRAAVVQGNIDQSLKWDPEFQQETLERYRRLSLEAARSEPAPEILVWPETAAPFFYGHEPDLSEVVRGIAHETELPLLFGSPGVEWVDGVARLYNRAYVIDPSGTELGRYAKRHLVPFGEYVPLKDLLFFVKRLVQAAGDFAPGEIDEPLKLDNQQLGTLICYEGIFPELSRGFADKGASVLVNITNDAWYGNTCAPYQHLQIARWRAVEFRVPLVRAANTGVSAVTDATGSVLGRIELNREGWMARTVHPLRVRTLYAAWGDFFAWLCVLTTAAALVYWARNRRRGE
jgi:apolipoprotein N-acyltransferase